MLNDEIESWRKRVQRDAIDYNSISVIYDTEEKWDVKINFLRAAGMPRRTSSLLK
jgi:hypothetical protein